MARMNFDTKAVHLPCEGQSGRFSWAKSDGISTNVCEQILTFIRNQLRNGRGKTGDNTEERYNGRRIIAGDTEGKRSRSVYGQTRAPEQPCIENVGNTWRKRGTFLQPGPSSVARLAVYFAAIRHEWECQPRRWYGHYTCSTGWERPTVRDTLHVSLPLSPSVSLLPFWFVPRDKAGTCPRPLCCKLSRGRSATREYGSLVRRRDRQQSRALYRRALIKFNVVERN